VGEVVDHPTVKTYLQKFRRRKNSKRFKGHRQEFTRVRIVELVLPGWERPPQEDEEEMVDQEGAEDTDEGEEDGDEGEHEEHENAEG
jgi:hypothetical protein